MYSPFAIETPRGKENTSVRRSLNRYVNIILFTALGLLVFSEGFKKTPPKKRNDLKGISEIQASPQLARDMQETQIRVFEFHHAAERILQNLRRWFF